MAPRNAYSILSVLVLAHAMINSSAANCNEPKLQEPAQSFMSVRQGHFVVKFSSTRDYVYQHYRPGTVRGYRPIQDIFSHSMLQPSSAQTCSPAGACTSSDSALHSASESDSH
jgi:hypothetical protein